MDQAYRMTIKVVIRADNEYDARSTRKDILAKLDELQDNQQVVEYEASLLKGAGRVGDD
jgi:hypothetical protein